MRNRLRGTLLSAAAGVAAVAAPSGDAAAQLPTVPVGSEAPAGRYVVPQGILPPAGPAEMAEALPPGMVPPPMSGPRPASGPNGGGPALLPDSLRPYPRISPYDHKFDQFSHDGNLWNRTMSNAPRQWYGGVSYINGKFKAANRTNIGSRRNLVDIVDEIYAPYSTAASGYNGNATFDTSLFQVFQFLYVKSVFIPQFGTAGNPATSYQYYGMSLYQALDPDGGFRYGDPLLVPYFDSTVAADGQGNPDGTTVADFFTQGPGTPGAGDSLDSFGYRPLTGDVLSTGDNQNLLPGYDEIFRTRLEDADHAGLRGRFGWEEADGSGFEFSADWLSEQADVYSRGDTVNAQRYFDDLNYDNSLEAIPGFFAPYDEYRPNLNYNTAPLGVIVVDVDPNLLNGRLTGGSINNPPNAGTTFSGLDVATFNVTPDGLNIIDPTVAAFTYDLLFENEFKSTQASTEFSYIFTPMLKHGKLRIRPSAGLRFNYVKEEFAFRGLDSGAIQIFDTQVGFGTPGPNPTVGLTQITGNAITGPTFAPPDSLQVINPATGSPFATDTVGYQPYHSRLTNTVDSYLFGPQLGLHMDVEGKFLSLRGHVKAGVAGLKEEILVEGEGFNLDQFTETDLMAFHDEQDHARFSPFIDANIRGEANLFPYIPVVNRMAFLKNARLTGGFNVTSFWELSRPLDSVIWREANSGNPYVNSDSDDRSQLYFTNWDVGVAWRY